MNISFTIPIKPVTKKNSSQIIRVHNSLRLIPSKLYLDYMHKCSEYIPNTQISTPINIKSLFYMPTRRKIDLTNLQEALHDVLKKYNCIADDNCNIIISTDGSRVLYDKENPRTEVFITDSLELPLSKK